MRAVGKVLLGIVVLAVVLVAAAGVLLATFNPNSYKGQIAALVQNKTGRTLTFGGDIKVVFYPILGFEASKVSLGNPPGFGTAEFLQVEEMQVGVKLIPLLHRQIELTTLRLKAPAISLIKRKDGHTNFEATASDVKPPAKATAAPGAEKAATAQQIAALQIEKLEISDASLTYTDQQTGKTVNVTPFNLKLGNFRFGQAAPLDIDFILHSGAPAQTVSVKLSGTVNADPTKGRYEVSKLQMTVKVQPAQGAALDISLSGNALVDQKAQTIAATDLHIKGAGVDATGTANIKGFTAPAVSFTLNAPSLDLAALPKSDTAPAETSSTAPATPTTKDDNKQLLPLAMLRTLKIDGKITVGNLKAGKLTLENIKTTIAAHGGVLTADPLSLDLYKGHLAASAKIDARTETPVLAVKGELKNLDVAEFLKAQMGEDYVTGAANSTFDLTSSGNTMRALQSNSGGKFAFAFGQGTINKWQLSKLINQATAFIKNGQTTAGASDQLSFSSLSGSFTGKNGVFSNSDLQLLGPQMHATGAGTVDLRQQQVNYTLKVGLGNDPAKSLNNKAIPIVINGPLTAPRYALDLQAIIAEFAGKKIEKQADKLLSKLTGDKTGAGDTNKNVKNLLKGFLGGAQQ